MMNVSPRKQRRYLAIVVILGLLVFLFIHKSSQVNHDSSVGGATEAIVKEKQTNILDGDAHPFPFKELPKDNPVVEEKREEPTEAPMKEEVTEAEISKDGPAPGQSVKDWLKSLVFEGANPKQMHGKVGLKSDGTPGFTLLPKPQNQNMAQALASNGFNARLSDSIPLDREVKDSRDPVCKTITFDLSVLPTTSVVIVFFNEWLSPLLRAVHSVLNRSPPELLYEIVLVDDGSDKPWLKEQLEEYVKLLPKVRLVRLPQRSGLVEARLKGAEVAKGDTVTVLDSHIEVQEGWLEPMMQRIHDQPNTVAMPIIDSEVQETFEPQAGGIGCSLGFLWSLVEHGISHQKVFEAKRKDQSYPLPTPTHAGGLFSVGREYFWSIGGYDRQFGWWGAENLEFSFRIWQCGGHLECTPCSRVYHIFRKGGHAYSLPGGHVMKNKLRTARIWMDEYAFISEAAIGNSNMDIGTLDEMKALRKKLNCKSFDWFLKNVYPEALFTDLDQIINFGNLKNIGSNKCFDGIASYAGGALRVAECNGGSGSQLIMMLSSGEILPVRNLEMCATDKLKFDWCQSWRKDTNWDFDTTTKQIKHRESHKCLAVKDKELSLVECQATSPEQQWELSRDKIPAESLAMHAARKGVDEGGLEGMFGQK